MGICEPTSSSVFRITTTLFPIVVVTISLVAERGQRRGVEFPVQFFAHRIARVDEVAAVIDPDRDVAPALGLQFDDQRVPRLPVGESM